jgi:hypothetical protein
LKVGGADTTIPANNRHANGTIALSRLWHAESRLSGSVAEDHSAHLIAQPFEFFGFAGAAETPREIEEFPLFAFFCQVVDSSVLPSRFGCASHDIILTSILAWRSSVLEAAG